MHESFKSSLIGYAIAGCALLISLDCLSQNQFIQRKSSMMHHALDVFDFDDASIKWNMKGDVQAFLNEGITALVEGNTERAIGQLTMAIDRDESLWVARYYRAICYKITFKANEALFDLLQADGLNSNQYEIKMELGKTYMIINEAKKAERFLNEATKLKPTEVQAYYFLALIQLFENNLNTAEGYFKKCDDLMPKFPDSKFQMGLILLRQTNNFEGAISLLTRAIELDSMHADARQTRFLIRLERKQDLSRALEDVNFLLTYNKFHLGWRMARAYLLIQYSNYDGAFLDIKRVLDASSMNQDNFMWRLGKVEHNIDIQNAGRYVVTKMYGLSDKNQVIIKKAFCKIVVGKYEEALAAMATSLQSDSHPAFLYLKGLSNELMGYWQDAQPYYNKALARDDDIFDLHRKRGNFHANLQQWKQAEKEFNVMERLYPDVISTYRVRGIARFYNKKYMEAIADLNHYLKVDSTNLECVAYRGRCYQAMGMMMPAIRDLAKGFEFDWIDFDRANKAIDTLIWNEDSVRLAQFTSYFSVFRPFPARSSRSEMLKLKLMLIGEKWSEIEREWNVYGNTQVIKDDKKFGSILFTVRGAELADGKNLNEALQMFIKAVSYDKDNAHAYFERGKLFLQLRNHVGAREDFSMAMQLGDNRATKYLQKIE